MKPRVANHCCYYHLGDHSQVIYALFIICKMRIMAQEDYEKIFLKHIKKKAKNYHDCYHY